jgi:hypothetical protein
MAVSSDAATPSARRSSTMMVVVSLTLLLLVSLVVVAMSYDNNLAPSAEVVAGSFSKRQHGRDIKDNVRQQQLRRTLQESFDDPIGSFPSSSSSLQDVPFFNPDIMNTIINSFTNMTNVTTGGLSPEEFANLTPEEIGQIMEQQGANDDDEMATLYQGIEPVITNLTDEIMEGANNYTNEEGGGGLSMEDLATLYQGIGPVITNLTDTVIDEFYNASSEMSIEDMLADLVNALHLLRRRMRKIIMIMP